MSLNEAFDYFLPRSKMNSSKSYALRTTAWAPTMI